MHAGPWNESVQAANDEPCCPVGSLRHAPGEVSLEYNRTAFQAGIQRLEPFLREVRCARSLQSLSLALAICIALCTCAAGPEPEYEQISLSTLRDKIAGGWAGQMIGVSYGEPTEFRYREAIIPEDKLPEWDPNAVASAIDQDDLYVDMTFAQVLDDKGLDATTEDFGAMFKEAQVQSLARQLGCPPGTQARGSCHAQRHAEVQRSCQ